MKSAGRLVLEDGREFHGRFFGAQGDFFGEVCFNTSLTGYQEILTDPSYTGQIVTLTVPQVGNTGVNDIDFESLRYRPSAFLVREVSPRVSNFRSQGTLSEALEKAGIGALEGIETRALTLHLRSRGALQGLVTPSTAPVGELVERIRKAPRLGDEDQVLKVTCKEPHRWTEALESGPFSYAPEFSRSSKTFKVAVMDYGVKSNILRMLVSAGCDVTVFPAKTPAEAILGGGFHGLFLSNGPGDPVRCTYAVDLVKRCLGKLPIFGICLGHQILGLALGGSTFKLKFGHRGGNHPVRDEASGRIEITSQNHGYALSPKGLPADCVVTHVNLNDGTVEGLMSPKHAAFSIQYHPESAPGPHDSSVHFRRFVEAMIKGSAAAA
ncbi:MAG: glutamine-hydrolyzing carbamoyl-phosphate synthase small subunit [Planctomycetota bacterium]